MSGYRNNKQGIAPIILIFALLAVSTIATGSMLISQPRQKAPPETPRALIVEATSTPVTKATASPKATTTPTPTQEPVETSTPAPKAQSTAKCSGPILTDLFIRPEDGKVSKIKYLNSFRDPETTAVYKLTDQPTFEPLLEYLNEELLACVLVRGSETIPAQNVKYSVTDNDQVISVTNIHEASLGFDGVNVCHRLPKTAGVHKISFIFNSDKSFCEPNFENNVASFTYTMKGDNDGPQFEIIGPHDLGSPGTCLWPGYLSDNSTEKQDIKLEQYIDDVLKPKHHSGGLCIEGLPGETHTYKVRATDKEGNTTEKSKTFQII